MILFFFLVMKKTKKNLDEKTERKHEDAAVSPKMKRAIHPGNVSDSLASSLLRLLAWFA